MGDAKVVTAGVKQVHMSQMTWGRSMDFILGRMECHWTVLNRVLCDLIYVLT